METIHAIRRPVYGRKDARGTFVEIIRGIAWRTVIHGRMRKGAVMGGHYHKRTRAYFHLVEGQAEIELVHVRRGLRVIRRLNAGEGIVLEPWWCHWIRYKRPSDYILLKTRSYSEKDPDTFPYPRP